MKNRSARFMSNIGSSVVTHHRSKTLPAMLLASLILSPVSRAAEVELFFESPADGSLVKSRTPSLRLRLSNYQDPGDSQLVLDVGGQNPAVCGLDFSIGVARCSLAELLPDGLQTINATLTSGGEPVARTAIAIAVDSDEDAVPNHEDSCAHTPLNETADDQGCALSQLDSDGDGISDGEEIDAGSDPVDADSYPPVAINAFTSLPDRIARVGDSAGLSWSVQGASSVTLINDADETQLTGLSPVGTAQVSPRINTTYTLMAEGPGGSASAQIQVTIASVQPENAWDPSPIEQVPEAISASLTVAEDGAVYLGAFDGNYYRFSPNGSLDWTLENIGVAMNKAAVSSGRVIVGTSGKSGGRILSLKADKSLAWEVHTPSGVVASPILNSDTSRVYVATYSGDMLGLSVADGSEQWRYTLPEGETVSAAPILSQDGSTLYVHSNNHQVFALSVSQPVLKSFGAGEKAPLIWQRDIGPGSGN